MPALVWADPDHALSEAIECGTTTDPWSSVLDGRSKLQRGFLSCRSASKNAGKETQNPKPITKARLGSGLSFGTQGFSLGSGPGQFRIGPRSVSGAPAACFGANATTTPPKQYLATLMSKV